MLLVTNIYPPLVGGPATFSTRFAGALAQRGFRTTVVCAVPGALESQLKYRLVRVGTRGGSPRRELDKRLKLLLEVLRSEVVFCAGLQKQVEWACRMLRRRYVLRIGGDVVWETARNAGITAQEPREFYADIDVYNHPKLGFLARQRAQEFERASRVIFVSRYLKELSRHWRVANVANGAVVTNGVETTSFHRPRQRTTNELNVLFVGRHVNWKGIDAAILSVQDIDGAGLTIAGSGPLEPALKDLVRRLGLSHKVRFEGSVETHRMLKFMHDHDVLVLPSLYEGMSNTLLEAGLAGIACIASDRAGNPEVIEDRVNGLLIDPFDPADLRDRLIELKNDEQLRLALAEAHQVRVLQDFDIDRTAQGSLAAAGLESADA